MAVCCWADVGPGVERCGKKDLPVRQDRELGLMMIDGSPRMVLTL